MVSDGHCAVRTVRDGAVLHRGLVAWSESTERAGSGPKGTGWARLGLWRGIVPQSVTTSEDVQYFKVIACQIWIS